MKYIYSAVFEQVTPDKVVASIPDLPGCVTSGHDLPDAIDMISDAAALWLVVAEDEDMDIPLPTEQSRIEKPVGASCSLVRIDTLAYRSATDTRAVRKNVSLPAWLATMADKRNINCSQVLQDSLKALLASN